MRNANDQLFAKILTNFDNFQKKRKTFSDKKIPNTVLNYYQYIIAKVEEIGQGKLTGQQLATFKTEYPDEVQSDDEDEELIFNKTFAKRGDRVAIKKLYRGPTTESFTELNYTVIEDEAELDCTMMDGEDNIRENQTVMI